MTTESTCPDPCLPPSLILRRLLDLSCFYARTAADERDCALELQQQLTAEVEGLRASKGALADLRKQFTASEAQVQQLQKAVAEVTSASALETRVLLQKIAQLSEGQQQGGSEQQLQVMRAENESLARALSNATQEVAALKDKVAAAQQQAQQLKQVKQQVSALAGDWQNEVHTRDAEVAALQQQLQKEKELTERLQHQQQAQQQQQALQLQHYTSARARVDELERQVRASGCSRERGSGEGLLALTPAQAALAEKEIKERQRQQQQLQTEVHRLTHIVQHSARGSSSGADLATAAFSPLSSSAPAPAHLHHERAHAKALKSPRTGHSPSQQQHQHPRASVSQRLQILQVRIINPLIAKVVTHTALLMIS
jgi:hypothetical protein